MDLPTVLEAIAGRVRAAGVDHVSTDPSKVRLPGVFVQFAGVDVDTLAGYTLEANLLIAAPDRDDPRALATLSGVLALVLAADLEFTGPVLSRGISFPNQPHPMPGLLVPVRVHETE